MVGEQPIIDEIDKNFHRSSAEPNHRASYSSVRKELTRR